MLGWGPDQIVIVYVLRACSKKNFESDPPIILVLGHIFRFFWSFWTPSDPFWAPLTQVRAMLSWGPGQIVIVYVPRASTRKNFESISPIILVFGAYFSSFWSFWAHLAPFRLFWAPLSQAQAKLSWGPGQIVIVYVPRVCTTKNLDSFSPIIQFFWHILLVFGHFEPVQAVFEPPEPVPG